MCNKLQLKIDHINTDKKHQAEAQKELHLLKAEAARLVKNASYILKDDSKVAICFDLQIMISTPYIINYKAYYVRQL